MKSPSTAQIASHLRRVHLFAQFSGQALLQLAACCRYRAYDSREALFYEGDEGHTLYMLLSGPVTRGIDLSDQQNVSGDGINMAQRVMDCGDAGHILLSQRSADDLRNFEMWADSLHDLGEVEVKHGVRLHLYSYYDGEVGNPARPAGVRTAEALESGGRQTSKEAASTVGQETSRSSIGGAVPLDSEFYISRPVDAEFIRAVTRQESIVLVKGARQMGKTSLLARGLQKAHEAGAKIVLTDFQMLNEKHLASADTLLLTLATLLAGRLGLSVSPRMIWDPDMGANLDRHLLQ